MIIFQDLVLMLTQICLWLLHHICISAYLLLKRCFRIEGMLRDPVSVLGPVLIQTFSEELWVCFLAQQILLLFSGMPFILLFAKQQWIFHHLKQGLLKKSVVKCVCELDYYYNDCEESEHLPCKWKVLLLASASMQLLLLLLHCHYLFKTSRKWGK